MSNNKRWISFLTIITILSASLCHGLDKPSPKNAKTFIPASAKKRSARSTKKHFLIKTIEGEELSRRLAKSVETTSHSFCHIVMGGGTLVDVSSHQQKTGFPLGEIYEVQGDRLGNTENFGNVNLRMGRLSLSFETDHCRWMGQLIRCEFNTPKGAMTGGLKLVRDVYVDRQGRVYIAFRVSGTTKNGRDLLSTGKLRFEIEPTRSLKSRWRVWYRLPDGSLRRPDQSQEKCEYELSGDKKTGGQELLIVVVPIRNDKKADSISSGEVEFESKISKRRPIQSMQSAMRRWIVNQFPGWDCPEPWLNKLWAGQVVSICQELGVDEERGEAFIPMNTPEDWRLLGDVRWLKDSGIVRRSVESAIESINRKTLTDGGWIAPTAMAMLECEPDKEFRDLIVDKISPMVLKWSQEVASTQGVGEKSKSDQVQSDAKLLLANYRVLGEWSARRNTVFLHREKQLAAMLKVPFFSETTSGELSQLLKPEYSLADYPAFVQWCRSFFPGGDFSWLVDLRIDSAHHRVMKRIPRGVMDLIITRIVGVRTHSTDRLVISPVPWIKHWAYFAIDNLPYRGHNLTIVWQSPDHVQRYAGIPPGFNIFVDGECVKQIQKLESVEIELR